MRSLANGSGPFVPCRVRQSAVGHPSPDVEAGCELPIAASTPMNPSGSGLANSNGDHLPRHTKPDDTERSQREHEYCGRHASTAYRNSALVGARSCADNGGIEGRCVDSVIFDLGEATRLRAGAGWRGYVGGSWRGA